MHQHASPFVQLCLNERYACDEMLQNIFLVCVIQVYLQSVERLL